MSQDLCPTKPTTQIQKWGTHKDDVYNTTLRKTGRSDTCRRKVDNQAQEAVGKESHKRRKQHNILKEKNVTLLCMSYQVILGVSNTRIVIQRIISLSFLSNILSQFLRSNEICAYVHYIILTAVDRGNNLSEVVLVPGIGEATEAVFFRSLGYGWMEANSLTRCRMGCGIGFDRCFLFDSTCIKKWNFMTRKQTQKTRVAQ